MFIFEELASFIETYTSVILNDRSLLIDSSRRDEIIAMCGIVEQFQTIIIDCNF